jgi:hypothetical protein
MSKNTQIFSEAIAEAKAIRETAMVNAKLALEEAFTPRLQEMMADRFSALSEEEEMEEGLGEETQNEEISLEELLAELDGLEEGHAEPDADNYGGPSDNDADNMEEAVIAEDDEDAVGEITVEELKDIIKDVMKDVMGGGEEEEGGEEEGEEEIGPETEEEAGEEELDLDEILAELALGESDDNDEDDLNEWGSGSAAGNAKDIPGPDLVKAVKELAAKLGVNFETLYDKIGMAIHGGKGVGNLEETKRVKKELTEAMTTINALRSDLNEVNLLNAKLLYVNKLFKAKNLTESQKVKVINAFDRAETVKEAKNVFEILSESLTAEKAKSQIKESLSFASKAAGVAPNRQPILENDAFVLRMQKIAGII